jgi:transcriptional regulator with XRE-family HTH domain
MRKKKIMEVFVQRLIGGRNRKGFTQTELAKELGVHLRSIQNWEGGLTEPRGKDLRKLSTVLGMSIPFMYGLDEKDPPAGKPGWFRPDEKGWEVRQLAHEYLDKVLDTCHGDKHRLTWTYVELQRRLPLPSSGAAAAAGELLSGAKASARRRGRASSR